jgi:hypothetical protein
MKYLILALFLSVISFAIVYYKIAKQRDCTKSVVPTKDKGAADVFRGWYDLSGCGTARNYCRWVGDGYSGGDPEITTNKGGSTWACTTAKAEYDGDFGGSKWADWPKGLKKYTPPRTDCSEDFTLVFKLI